LTRRPGQKYHANAKSGGSMANSISSVRSENRGARIDAIGLFLDAVERANATDCIYEQLAIV
jgi:hypothetical protein